MKFEDEILRLMIQPGLPGRPYYCLTMLATDEGRLFKGCNSYWVGYTDTRPTREIRAAAPLDGPRQREKLQSIGQTCLLINVEDDLQFWYAFGGNAVILDDIANSCLYEELQPGEVAIAMGPARFISTDNLEPHKLQHAPSKITRMKVLTRDGRRCFICGRSPANYVDLELHVHHIVPWGIGGLTEEKNLVTLCGTCHKGLDPHFDWQLADTVKQKHHASEPEYAKQLENYQRWVRKIMQTEL